MTSLDDDLEVWKQAEATGSSCEAERIHRLGQIQGGGVGNAIFLSGWPGDPVVVAADATIARVPWINSNTVVGKRASDVIPHSIMASLQQSVRNMVKNRTKRAFLFLNAQETGGKHEHMSAISISSTKQDFSIICLEIEEVPNAQQEQAMAYESLAYLGSIKEFEDDLTMAKVAIEFITQVLNGYDRGMVYRFHADGAGEIIHEVVNDPALESRYMGLRFPSSDIPMSARKLYIINGHRYVYDTHAEDVPVTCMEGHSLDLTQCRMRASSSVHVQYLKNMGVRATMSLPIIVRGELWGLLVFHSYHKPYKPTLHQRIACETLSHAISIRTEALQKEKETI